MKKIRKDIEISDLIYKSLRGETSKSEDELLEAWCLEPRNRKLFMELREADYLYEGVADMYNVDTKEPFKNVEDRIRRGKRVRLMKYVSGVAAVLLVGVVFGFDGKGRKDFGETGVTFFYIKGKDGAFCDISDHGWKGCLSGRLCKTRGFGGRRK